MRDSCAALGEALRLADLGYRVFPCRPGGKEPTTPHGCLDATTDADQINEWWGKNPACNLAVSTDDLAVIDVDPVGFGEPNPWLTPEVAYEMSGAPQSTTPRGGRHFWFRQPDGVNVRNSAGKIAPGVDVRASGGYVLVVPSVTQDGDYRWLPDSELDGSPADLPELPAWLLSELDSKPAGETAVANSDSPATISEGSRNATLTSLGGHLRRIGLSQNEIEAALTVANRDRCNPHLSDPEVQKIARSVARYEPDQVATAVAEGWAEQDRRKPVVFELIDSEAFDKADFRAHFYVKRVLVAGQNMILGGAQKSMKTSIAVDLAISLGTAAPFLGQFEVPQIVPTGILSGESGGFTLQETARRVSRSKSVELKYCAVHWGFSLPQLGLSAHLDSLRKSIEQYGIKVMIIDPAYLCMLQDDSGKQIDFKTLFSMGGVFQKISAAFAAVGCTPILLHHESKGAATVRRFDPMQLSDLSMSGFAEWARQWILLSRRSAYDAGSGLHELWANVGGSAGHGGLWSVDINEGILQDDFAGRIWSVAIGTASEVRKEQRNARDAIKAEKAKEKQRQDEQQLLVAYGKFPDGETKKQLRLEAGMNPDKFDSVNFVLLSTARVVKCRLKKNNRSEDGFRLANAQIQETETPEEERGNWGTKIDVSSGSSADGAGERTGCVSLDTPSSSTPSCELPAKQVESAIRSPAPEDASTNLQSNGRRRSRRAKPKTDNADSDFERHATVGV